MNIASRALKTLSDVTVGTVIVLVHVALADRTHTKEKLALSARERPRTLPVARA
jgi:hypothetical protein